MAKVPLPASDLPPTLWGRILSFTPVVMTVVATLLAGLSNSEMTRSQVERTAAAQMQSKAGDQWNYFQAKKLRALETKNTRDILLGTANVGTFEGNEIGLNLEKIFDQLAKQLVDGSGPAATLGPPTTGLKFSPDVVAALDGAAAPESAPWQPHDPAVKKIADLLATGTAEVDIAPLIPQVTGKTLADEIQSAASYSNDMDARSSPISSSIDHMEGMLVKVLRLTRGGTDAAIKTQALQLYNSFAVARLGYISHRYDIEARHNQATALLYEIQVRMDNALSDRFQERSKRFFFGMLAAQAAVIVSSMALAVQQKSLLWSFAAAVGLAAVSFATYVYLFV